MFHGVDGLVEAAGYDVWRKETAEGRLDAGDGERPGFARGRGG
jgi:hypothetical protein